MTTAQDDVRERVMSYVRHQVGKGPEAMRSVIQKGHDQLLAAIDGLSEEQAKFKAGPDEWSALEVLRHAEESKRGIARRCVQLARGESLAALTASGTIAQEPLSSLAEARSAVNDAHQDLLAFLDTISPETNLEAKFEHPAFGAFNCQEWAVFQRPHDGDHAEQIEQVKAAPGYPTA